MDPDEPLERTPGTRQARAEDAMRAIAAGADPSEEALRLANGFTDETMARLSSAVRRMLRLPPRP